MKQEQILTILYDMALLVGGESAAQPLLTKTLQRLLYHTSFPCGLFLSEIKTAHDENSFREGLLEAAIGDQHLVNQSGQRLTLPAILVTGEAAQINDRRLLNSLCHDNHSYTTALRLPAGSDGLFLLLSPDTSKSDLLFTQIFSSVLDNFARTLTLCRSKEQFTQQLLNEYADSQIGLYRFRAALDSSDDCIFLIDPKRMRFIDSNKTALATMGLTREELLLMGPEDIQPEYSREALQTIFQQIIGGDMSHRVITTLHQRKDGTTFPAEVHLNASRQDRRLPVITALCRDITEHKRTEAIQQAHIHYLNSMQRIADAIASNLDPDKMLHEVIRVVQETFQSDRAWLLYPCDSNTKNWSVPVEVTAPEFPGAFSAGEKLPVTQEIAAVFNDALASDGPVLYNQIAADSVLTKQFSIRSQMVMALHPRYGKPWLFSLHQCSSTRECSSDEQRLFKAIAHRLNDILSAAYLDRELKEQHAHLEELVAERTRALEVTNKELEAFSYSVSHDLRAPLRSIDGFSQALLEDYHDKLDETGEDYLKRVRAASQHMGELIDDMLNLSRVSRRELNYREVDLAAMAMEINAQLQEQQPQRQVITTIQEGVHASGDVALLRIALTNLLSNAWKYTSRCQHPQIRFQVEQKGDKRIFSVSDNGTGFNMRYAGNLFKAFQRLHKPDEFEGTGIGLATVARIIHRHGGEVWAEAKEGRGATFYFTLGNQGDREESYSI